MGSQKIPIGNRYQGQGPVNPWISKAQSEMQIARRQMMQPYEQVAKPIEDEVLQAHAPFSAAPLRRLFRCCRPSVLIHHNFA